MFLTRGIFVWLVQLCAAREECDAIKRGENEITLQNYEQEGGVMEIN